MQQEILKNFRKVILSHLHKDLILNQPIVKYCLSSVIACTDIRSIHKIFRVRKQLIKNNLNKLELE